jgi:hypothetical protein
MGRKCAKISSKKSLDIAILYFLYKDKKVNSKPLQVSL